MLCDGVWGEAILTLTDVELLFVGVGACVRPACSLHYGPTVLTTGSLQHVNNELGWQTTQYSLEPILARLACLSN